MAQLATGALLAAALGGLVLNLNYHWKGLPLPVPFMLGPAALTAAGFVVGTGVASPHQPWGVRRVGATPVATAQSLFG
jgi:hypothetical protein